MKRKPLIIRSFLIVKSPGTLIKTQPQNSSGTVFFHLTDSDLFVEPAFSFPMALSRRCFLFLQILNHRYASHQYQSNDIGQGSGNQQG